MLDADLSVLCTTENALNFERYFVGKSQFRTNIKPIKFLRTFNANSLKIQLFRWIFIQRDSEFVLPSWQIIKRK